MCSTDKIHYLHQAPDARPSINPGIEISPIQDLVMVDAIVPRELADRFAVMVRCWLDGELSFSKGL